MTRILMLILWIVLMDKDSNTINPKIDKDNFRAAIYSFEVDFSKAQQFVPEIQNAISGLSTISYKYYIQYGNDTLIEIVDPGNEIRSFSGSINEIDYARRESTFTVFMDHARKYHTTKDSITYSIEGKRGFAAVLCEGVELNSRCDSVTFILHDTKAEYKLFFNDTISNLRAHKLFYPDIKYLPCKIVRTGKRSNTFTLEEVLYGKASIDSLLQLYEYEGYEQVTDEEISPADRQLVMELIEKLKCNE